MLVDRGCRYLQLGGELAGRRRPFALQAIQQGQPDRVGQCAHRLGIGQDEVADRIDFGALAH